MSDSLVDYLHNFRVAFDAYSDVSGHITADSMMELFCSFDLVVNLLADSITGVAIIYVYIKHQFLGIYLLIFVLIGACLILQSRYQDLRQLAQFRYLFLRFDFFF